MQCDNQAADIYKTTEIKGCQKTKKTISGNQRKLLVKPSWILQQLECKFGSQRRREGIMILPKSHTHKKKKKSYGVANGPYIKIWNKWDHGSITTHGAAWMEGQWVKGHSATEKIMRKFI